jgi:hypothetical protein
MRGAWRPERGFHELGSILACLLCYHVITSPMRDARQEPRPPGLRHYFFLLRRSDSLRTIMVVTLLPEKESLVNARIGQGPFREQVLQLWGRRCALTRSATLAAIRASHIKPWCDSTDEERLDPYNGIPLIASLDALFDAGLISFQSTGKLIVSAKLTTRERRIFGVGDGSLTIKPSPRLGRSLALPGCDTTKIVATRRQGLPNCSRSNRFEPGSWQESSWPFSGGCRSASCSGPRQLL